MASAALPDIFNSPRESVTLPANGAVRSATIVTWNIDKGTELGKIQAELEKRPADLYLLQEVDLNTRRGHNLDEAVELAGRLHMNFVYGRAFEELSQEDHGPAYTGQATLTRLPIRQARILRFHRQSGFWKPHAWLPSNLPLMQRRLGNRIALVTELTFNNRLLVVYNVHLESRSNGRIQMAQLDEIFEDLKRYPPQTDILLGGDLNSKYFASYYLKKLEKNGFHNALGQKIERTHRIMMALDWIFARGPIALSSGKVDQSAEGSDHYPVYAVMRAE
jgi:endonuclease/exonuclease/phosphatase family metal-dependent hydrolase